MFKRKLKQNIMLEYINICNIYNFSKKHNHAKRNINLARHLKRQYEQIMLKMGVIDLSFAILQKELKAKDQFEFNFEQEAELNKHFGCLLKRYNCELMDKMHKLLFNDFEIKYIISFS